MALKELEVGYATKRSKDDKPADGEEPYLLVRPNESKLWRFKYRCDGKEKLLSFGAYPDVSSAIVRLRCAEAKVALGQGAGPAAKAAPPLVITFEEVARAWHGSRLLTRLERDAFPAFDKAVVHRLTRGFRRR